MYFQRYKTTPQKKIMDEQKSGNSIYTEWVQCPFCHKIIKAPNQPGLIFSCPNCDRELKTYDKKYDYSKEHAEVPPEIKKWSWAAFFFGSIWAIMNGIRWPLYIVAISIFVDIIIEDYSFASNIYWIIASAIIFEIINIALGINGNEWAWKAKSWDSVAHFQSVQRKWNIATICFVIILFILWFIIGILFNILNYISTE